MPTAIKPETTTGILTIDEAASALGITPLAVLRLIAKGRLPGTNLTGDVMGWRVLANQLEVYVASGAVDVRPPALDDVWIHDPDRFFAETLAGKLIDAAAPQAKTDAEIVAYAKSHPNLDSAEFKLTASSAMLTVMYAPIPSFTAEVDAMRSRYRNQGEAMLVERLRNEARTALQNDSAKLTIPLLKQLYGFGPKAFQAIAADALKMMGSRKLVFSKALSVDWGDPTGPRTFRASFTLPVSDLMGTYNTGRLIDLAF